MDIVYLRDLELDIVIGVFDWERETRQTVVLDIDLGTDVAAAARTDELADALDYKAVTKRVMQFVGESEFALIETLAERVAALLMSEFGVPWLRLRVTKPGALRGVGDVGVVIERGTRA